MGLQIEEQLQTVLDAAQEAVRVVEDAEFGSIQAPRGFEGLLKLLIVELFVPEMFEQFFGELPLFVAELRIDKGNLQKNFEHQSAV